MKLIELKPSWISTGDDREGMGLSFACPIDGHKHGGFAVWFANPLDGGAPIEGYPLWTRTGDYFGTLTLSPSLQANPGDPEYHECHFFIRNGELIPA